MTEVFATFLWDV